MTVTTLDPGREIYVNDIPAGGQVEQLQRCHPRSLLAQMLTVKQAARRLGISPVYLSQLIRGVDGPKHHYFDGDGKARRRILFRPEDLDAWKAARAA